MTGSPTTSIWITGGGGGLGLALARRLAETDDRPIVLSGRRAEALDQAVASSGGRFHAIPLDVTDRAATAEAVARIERTIAPVGLAVLNAGTHEETSADRFDAATIEHLVRANLVSVAYGLEALLPRMRARGAGRIAVTASVAGYRGLPRAAGYCAAKAGVIALCESLRAELGAVGVTLQVCNPGFVRTPLTDRNTFPMPFLMDVDVAARAYERGLRADRFEITFPRRFTWMMKLVRVLPAALYFPLIRATTGVR